jgi:hypothetical protein
MLFNHDYIALFLRGKQPPNAAPRMCFTGTGDHFLADPPRAFQGTVTYGPLRAKKQTQGYRRCWLLGAGVV